MIDGLPLEIRVEILKRVPVKFLIRSRIVSKAWKSLIDTSHFINHYSRYHAELQHILVMYEQPHDDNPNYVSITDDHTFPQTQVFPTVPLMVNMLKQSLVIGSSHGLVCVYGVHPNNSFSKWDTVVLWNPSIRRAIPVVVPNVTYGIYHTVVGFGVCPKTIDPKIVKITYIKSKSDIESINSIPWQVEVFTLSTGVWRRPYTSNLPRKSIEFDWFHVAVDGFLYWLSMDRITMDNGHTSYNLIMSFDITSEEFRQVNLPHSLAHSYYYDLSLSRLRESLVVVQDVVDAINLVTNVWMMMMEDGPHVAKTFVKLFSVNVGTPNHTSLRGFRKSGEPIIQISEDNIPTDKLVAYDPNSKHIDYLGISAEACYYFVYPYTETLLLLDQPNLVAYNEMETIKLLDDLFAEGA